MKFRVLKDVIHGKNVTKFKILQGEKRLTFNDVIIFWKNSIEFIEFYNSILAESNYDSFFWEHPPMNIKSLESYYEFVLIKTNALSKITQDEFTFSEYFSYQKKANSFYNLGKNAKLIIPTLTNKSVNYSSISKFVRTSNKDQYREFWKLVGVEYETELGDKWKWLSTSGLGIHWLHVRIDSRPKYYTFKEYKGILN